MLLVSAAQGEPAVSMHVSPPLGPPSRLPLHPMLEVITGHRAGIPVSHGTSHWPSILYTVCMSV